MPKRRRVGLRESFTTYMDAYSESHVSGGWDESLTIVLGVFFGFWWWIAGVPESKRPTTQPHESDPGNPH